MVKIHLVGGEAIVVEIANVAALPELLRDPDAVLQVTYDRKPVLIPVRAIAAVVHMS
jgi:hypothetical protein